MRYHSPFATLRKTTGGPRPLIFTPAEWRVLLDDPGFLKDADNRWGVSRRLMGLPVRIVPDHQTEFTAATLSRLAAGI